MIILGIDPGYGRCGYGVIDDTGPDLEMVANGVIETPPSLPFPERLLGVKASIVKLIQDHEPNYLAVEKPIHGKNVSNSVEVGAAWGAVLLAAIEQGIPILIYYPTQVKAAVASGDADKEVVQHRVKLILGLSKVPRPDDAADALAVAICGANRYMMDSLEMDYASG